MTIRLFVALEIPEEALSKIIDIKNAALGNLHNVRWEPKEKLHLTLKFLGDTNSDLIEKYSDAMQRIINSYKSFELGFNKFGIFIKDNNPKILWVGLCDNPSLLHLVKDIDEIFSEFGFEKEKRKFKSHLTLLRFRGHEDSEKILSLLNVNLQELNFNANKVTLFESKLLPSSSIYRSIKSFYLKN